LLERELTKLLKGIDRGAVVTKASGQQLPGIRHDRGVLSQLLHIGKEAGIPGTAVLKESGLLQPLQERRRPEQNLPWRIIDRHYPKFHECFAR